MLFSSNAAETWLIAGLGNPGREYEKTRHNTGFLALDLLAKALGVRVNKPKFKGEVGVCDYKGKRLILVRPQTYMNASGLCIEPCAHFYKIPPERIIVIFDDISLPVGRIRVRKNGSAGGHNGIKSIISSLGTDAFPRVKVGVGDKPHPDYDLADWVLSNIPKEDQEAFQTALHHRKSRERIQWEITACRVRRSRSSGRGWFFHILVLSTGFALNPHGFCYGGNRSRAKLPDFRL